MPTTDTFIIPPMQPAEETKKEKKTKKKSGSNKVILLVGLVLLIITLPVAIYFITQQQQLADTRSRAKGTDPTSAPTRAPTTRATVAPTRSATIAPTGRPATTAPTRGATTAPTTAAGSVYQCSGGETRCQTNSDGTNTGYICTCASTPKGREWSCGQPSTSCPKGSSNSSGSTAGTRSSPDGTAGGCGYIQKPPNSGTQSCNVQTCGMECGKFTYDCGQLCFDSSCGGTGCASGGGVGLTTETTVEEPTPTEAYNNAIGTTPTPTTAPNSGVCDASCSTDSNCASGLSCASVDGINRCRNASCPAESACTCTNTNATNTPVPTTANIAVNNNNATTGQAMPTSGAGPGAVGVITIIGSVLLLVAGIVL